MIHEKYWIPNNFHLHALRPEDQVTSDLANYLIVYEEDLNANLRFPFMT